MKKNEFGKSLDVCVAKILCPLKLYLNNVNIMC